MNIEFKIHWHEEQLDSMNFRIQTFDYYSCINLIKILLSVNCIHYNNKETILSPMMTPRFLCEIFERAEGGDFGFFLFCLMQVLILDCQHEQT